MTTFAASLLRRCPPRGLPTGAVPITFGRKPGKKSLRRYVPFQLSGKRVD